MGKKKNGNSEEGKEVFTPNQLEKEILKEAVKITTNKVSSCYVLVQKTKKLLELRKMETEESED